MTNCNLVGRAMFARAKGGTLRVGHDRRRAQQTAAANYYYLTITKGGAPVPARRPLTRASQPCNHNPRSLNRTSVVIVILFTTYVLESIKLV